MKNIALLLLLSISINVYSNEPKAEPAKNEFTTTNRKQDILEIGKLLNNAIVALQNAVPKEYVDQEDVEANMDSISRFFGDSARIEEAIDGRLNDNEVKAVLILLKKLSTVQELQYLPMMISMLFIKARDFVATNKEGINTGLKSVIGGCENVLENLNQNKPSA